MDAAESHPLALSAGPWQSAAHRPAECCQRTRRAASAGALDSVLRAHRGIRAKAIALFMNSASQKKLHAVMARLTAALAWVSEFLPLSAHLRRPGSSAQLLLFPSARRRPRPQEGQSVPTGSKRQLAAQPSTRQLAGYEPGGSP